MAKAQAKSATTKPSHNGFVHMQTKHGFEEYTLTKNGLTVLYRHDTSAPVGGLMVTYLVGSRYEATGHTGATHLLEHLMFKGSKRFPKVRGMSVIDRLEEKGARMNASTWFDRTNYYEVLPQQHLEFAIELEADRMRNAVITEKDKQEELPAVQSEYAMVKNMPTEELETHIWATAFQAHPYHHSTIGWLSDVENVSLQRLKQFYDTYYWPDNAVVSVISPFDRSTTLGLVKKHFEKVPRAPFAIPQPYTQEPEQTGPRFVDVRRAGTTNIVSIAFKVPEARHTDTTTLLVLEEILGAGRKSSRLYKTFVDSRLAVSAHVNYWPFHDPSLFAISVELAPGVQHEKVQELILKELKRLEDGVTPDELHQAHMAVRTDLARSQDGHLSALSVLNEAIATGDWRFYYDLPAKLKKVASNSVVDVARRYFSENGMTVGYYRSTM
jgi:zinc protease